jgi:asparagine synthase (glutamine-hydrolysing)
MMINVKGSRIAVSSIPFLSLYKFGLLKRGLSSKNHMNPLEYWYRTNADIAKFQDDYFTANIENVTSSELRSNCRKLYMKGTAIEKNQVLTLLSALKLFY